MFAVGTDGFLSLPRLTGEILYEEESPLEKTRVWFGPKRDAFAMVKDAEVNLAHIATRIYSAGSDPTKPGKESQAPEDSRRVLNWWDRHYERVAAYEPEYHRLNQIMKWSMLTGLLRERMDVQGLRGLRNVEVNRTLRFDRWYAETQTLKYRGPVRFVDTAHWPNGRECMERLRSYGFQRHGTDHYIEGGISGGSARSINEGTHVSELLEPSLRRGGVDYAKTADREIARLGDGTRFNLIERGSDSALRIKMTPGEQARLRTGTTELRGVQEFEVMLAAGSHDDVTLSLSAGGRDLGRLGFKRAPNKLDITLSEGDLSSLREAATELSYARRPEEAAEKLARYATPEHTFLIQDEHGGLQAMVEGGGGAGRRGGGGNGPGGGGTPSAGGAAGDGGGRGGGHDMWFIPDDGSRKDPLLRAAGPSTPRPVIVVATSDSQDRKMLDAIPWQQISVAKEGSAGAIGGTVHREFRFSGPGKDARRVTVKLDNPALPEVEAFVDKESVYLRRPAAPEQSDAFNHLVTDEGWSKEQLSQIRLYAVAEAKGPLVLPKASGAPGEHVAQALSEGRLGEALEELAAIHREQKLDATLEGMRESAVRDAFRDLRDGRRSDLARDFAEGLVGEEPKVQVLRAFEKLDERNLQQAVLLAEAAARNERPGLREVVSQLHDRPASEADLTEYLRAKAGVDRMDPALRADLELHVDGSDVHTALKVAKAPKAKPLTMEERKAVSQTLLTSRDAEVYVEDTKPLQQLDWDSAPGRSVATAASDPTVVWETLESEAFGDVRPAQLVLDQRTYTRRSVSSSRVSARGHRPIYLVRFESPGPSGPLHSAPIMVDEELCAR